MQLTRKAILANQFPREKVVRRSAPAIPLKISGAILCLFPWLLATFFQASPELSWPIAWLGSWAILALVFTGHVFRLPSDRPLRDQILRPWFLAHLVFAGYNFLTAIFYWLDLNGITLGLSEPVPSSMEERSMAAEAQRFYVLGHAGLVIGLGLSRQIPLRLRFQQVAGRNLAATLLTVAAASLLLREIFGFVPGLSQFAVKMQGLSVVSAGVSSGVAMHFRPRWLPITVALNALLLMIALGSGWKEEVFVLVLLNAASFYPRAPRLTTIITGLIFLVGIVVLPAVANSIRKNVWKGEVAQSKGLRLAVDDLQTKSVSELKQDTWHFLTGRFSEASLFVRYLEDVPEINPYDGVNLVQQAMLAPVPRILWPGKPNLEDQVRERVIGHGVVSDSSDVSAKPQYIVDGFLTAGAPGVFLSLLFLGWVAQTCSRICEQNLGGYFLGGVAFNGLFSIFWRGNCFEFLANSVVWSIVLIFVIRLIAQNTGVIRRT